MLACAHVTIPHGHTTAHGDIPAHSGAQNGLTNMNKCGRNSQEVGCGLWLWVASGRSNSKKVVNRARAEAYAHDADGRQVATRRTSLLFRTKAAATLSAAVPAVRTRRSQADSADVRLPRPP